MLWFVCNVLLAHALLSVRTSSAQSLTFVRSFGLCKVYLVNVWHFVVEGNQVHGCQRAGVLLVRDRGTFGATLNFDTDSVSGNGRDAVIVGDPAGVVVTGITLESVTETEIPPPSP